MEKIRYTRPMIRIEALYFYPVKSCAGISTDSLKLEEEGPQFDREWMIVNSTGQFLTQREDPKLGLIIPSLNSDSLTLQLNEKIRLPLDHRGKNCKVMIWGEEVEALDEGDLAAKALADFLGQEARLMRIGKRFTGPDKISVRFPDAFPLHLCSLESLQDLNTRGKGTWEVLRFRPNIVISGAQAWSEDHWQKIQIGSAELKFTRACTRCPITTITPGTLLKSAEPLKTLSTFRRNAKNKVEFGQYLLSDPGAELRVGMECLATKA